jgi:hypothetical protein
MGHVLRPPIRRSLIISRADRTSSVALESTATFIRSMSASIKKNQRAPIVSRLLGMKCCLRPFSIKMAYVDQDCMVGQTMIADSIQLRECSFLEVRPACDRSLGHREAPLGRRRRWHRRNLISHSVERKRPANDRGCPWGAPSQLTARYEHR